MSRLACGVHPPVKGVDAEGLGALIDVFGDEMVGAWNAASATEGSFFADGYDETADMVISDGRLTMEQDGSSMTFVR